MPALSSRRKAASRFCNCAVEAPSLMLSPSVRTIWMFSAFWLFTIHFVWLLSTWGKYCVSFCGSGNTTTVKSGGLTCAEATGGNAHRAMKKRKRPVVDSSRLGGLAEHLGDFIVRLLASSKRRETDSN